jgi:two-component system, OmpR family, response regulator
LFSRYFLLSGRNIRKQKTRSGIVRESRIVRVMTGEPHLLIVEDDREIRALIARLLRANGYRVSAVADGREMDRALGGSRIDLIILDVMLPGEDGLSLCRRLRASSGIPIIILSAKGDEIDRVLGLEMGADDYIAKPFNPREVLARIRAVLRRSAGQGGHDTAETASAYAFCGWRVDVTRRFVLDPAGTRVSITEAEFDLLRIFCARPGRLMTRDQLIDLTQGRSAGPNERSIDILVARLRRKMAFGELDADFIRTVRSGGYMFTPAVEAQ